MRVERKFLVIIILLNVGLLWILLQTQMVQQFAIEQRGKLPVEARQWVEAGMDQIEQLRNYNREYARFLLLLFLSSSIAVCGLVYLWFVKPIKRLSRSMTAGNPGDIADLSLENGELGALARLVLRSRQQQQALESEVELRNNMEAVLRRREKQMSALIRQREQISRDLHDGLIQSLYALGLRLELARSGGGDACSTTPPEELRTELNEIIRQVRGFIDQSPRLQGDVSRLRDYLETLVERMNRLGKASFHLEWDSRIEDVLDLDQASHIQAIVTEAVSNALRHSGAGAIHIRCRMEEGRVAVAIEDDGTGHDPATGGRGHGLENMASRARELGADFTLDSAPGSGCRVRLEWTVHETRNN